MNYWNFSLKTIVSTSRRVWTFWDLGRFVFRTFWGLGRFDAWDVLYWGRFRFGRFWGLGRFIAGTFCIWDVLGFGTFWGLGRFVFGTFCIWDVFLAGTLCLWMGGMTMHPQTKRPWSFQPWTMSLSGRYVPRLNWTMDFRSQVFFVPECCIPANILPFLGLNDHPQFSNFDYDFWSLCPHLQHLWVFI